VCSAPGSKPNRLHRSAADSFNAWSSLARSDADCEPVAALGDLWFRRLPVILMSYGLIMGEAEEAIRSRLPPPRQEAAERTQSRLSKRAQAVTDSIRDLNSAITAIDAATDFALQRLKAADYADGRLTYIERRKSLGRLLSKSRNQADETAAWLVHFYEFESHLPAPRDDNASKYRVSRSELLLLSTGEFALWEASRDYDRYNEPKTYLISARQGERATLASRREAIAFVRSHQNQEFITDLDVARFLIARLNDVAQGFPPGRYRP
jgi:hypothetical protein